jgi:3-oxoacyl-[acyl-carrier protein] reductase
MTAQTARTILVTGAASGMGLACAELLRARGDNVIAFDIAQAALAKAFSGNEVQTVAGDISSPADCARAVESAIGRFGALDGLIHFAAVLSNAPWETLDQAEFARTLSINTVGSFLIAQAAARPMVARGKGSIVLTGSDSILIGPAGGAGQAGPAYTASKGAVVALARSLARALAPNGVRVNVVGPGITETPMIESFAPEYRATMQSRYPFGRFGRPEEIARVAAFLVSDDASWISGQVIYANGASNFG